MAVGKPEYWMVVITMVRVIFNYIRNVKVYVETVYG